MNDEQKLKQMHVQIEQEETEIYRLKQRYRQIDIDERNRQKGVD